MVVTTGKKFKEETSAARRAAPFESSKTQEVCSSEGQLRIYPPPMSPNMPMCAVGCVDVFLGHCQAPLFLA